MLTGATYNKVEVFAQNQPFNQRITILVRCLTGTAPNCVLAFAQPVTMSPVVEGSVIQPTIELDYDVAQQLDDELWRCGIKPTESHGSAGELGATKRHLEDMRHLAFQEVGVPKPSK